MANNNPIIQAINYLLSLFVVLVILVFITASIYDHYYYIPNKKIENQKNEVQNGN